MGVQVQSATKNREGKPLSVLNRQFISFSYGGKDIEDFDLLAVFSGGRLDKEVYAPFNDTVTEQTELDGQLFWRTNFKANQINFNLATDGMTSHQLEEFKRWFKPGTEKELILTEYHNRAIMARVSTPPQISLLPFEKKTIVKVGYKQIQTSISLYKGDIKISFVMDDPYWYSKRSYLDSNPISKEDVKLIYEDGIPHIKMFSTQASCFLADGYCYNYSDNSDSIQLQNNFNLSYRDEANCFLYYCGSAPEKPILTFKMIPIKNGTTGKITFACRDENSNFYLGLGSDETWQTFEFTYPNIISSYNKALDIVDSFEGTSILDLRREIRDSLFNHHARSYAIGVIDYAKNNKINVDVTGNILDGFKTYFISQMLRFFVSNSAISFYINGKTGVVTATCEILQITGEQSNNQNAIPATSKTITENTGNMLKSNYLTIDTRTLPEDGLIKQAQCLPVVTNSEIKDLKINYKYRYL